MTTTLDAAVRKTVFSALCADPFMSVDTVLAHRGAGTEYQHRRITSETGFGFSALLLAQAEGLLGDFIS